MVRFSDLGIKPSLVESLSKEGIIEPFEVQIEAIPSALEGRDICCRAPTGSGKTLAFGLPLISMAKPAASKRPTALILTPTRELAEQIRNVLDPLAWSYSKLKVLSIYGGSPYGRQIRALEKGVEIIVACPGRLLDLIERGALALDEIDILVLDEADRMADMGFMEPVCKIIDKCASNPQMILFSATLDRDVSRLVRTYQNDPVKIEVGPEEVSMETMDHKFWNIKPHKKTEIAVKSVRRSGRSIIFCRTRAGVDRLSEEMKLESVPLSSLHGGLNQKQRDRAMNKFSSGRSMVLIATDVAARGIDVARVDNAGSFNYENTLIVDWKGNIEKVLVLAQLLKIDPKHIIVYDRPSKPLDATLVLGKDWVTVIDKLKESKSILKKLLVFYQILKFFF